MTNTASIDVRTINHRAVVVTGFVAFAASLCWYSPILFGGIWMRLRTSGAEAPGWTMLLAPLRELIVAYVLAQLLVRLAITSWRGAASLALGLWFAFHAVGMAGAVIWDHMPWPLGAVHAGDWLMKMLLMAIMLRAWTESAS